METKEVVLFNRLMSLNASNILEFRENLKNDWKPKTIQEAIIMKNIQHIFAYAKDGMDEAIEEYLNRCKLCDNMRIDPDTGLKVLRKKKPAKKDYNVNDKLLELSGRLIEIDKQIEENCKELFDEKDLVKAMLEVEKEKVGFTQQDNGFYYTAKF